MSALLLWLDESTMRAIVRSQNPQKWDSQTGVLPNALPSSGSPLANLESQSSKTVGFDWASYNRTVKNNKLDEIILSAITLFAYLTFKWRSRKVVVAEKRKDMQRNTKMILTAYEILLPLIPLNHLVFAVVVHLDSARDYALRLISVGRCIEMILIYSVVWISYKLLFNLQLV